MLSTLKTVNLELVAFGKTRLGQPLTDILSLVALQLQDFTIFWVLHHSPVASKFLSKQFNLDKSGNTCHLEY